MSLARSPFTCYYSSDSLKIYFGYLEYAIDPQGEGYYPTDKQLEQLGPLDHVFLFLQWHRLGFDTARLRAYKSFACKIVLCANTPSEHNELQSAGLDSIYFNQNASLDASIFRITSGPDAARQYRLVVNSMFAKYKRTHLAAGVEGTAFITYECDRHQDEAIPTHGNWLNLEADGVCHYLSSAEVAAALNLCGVGGIFSAEEGACYASTEYLLCGLPVVSTASRGGRDVWYNEHNSIIVEPTVDAVRAGVSAAEAMLCCGEFNREQIRSDAVQLASSFWSTLNKKIQCIFDCHAVALCAAEYQMMHFVHKMGL